MSSPTTTSAPKVQTEAQRKLQAKKEKLQLKRQGRDSERREEMSRKPMTEAELHTLKEYRKTMPVGQSKVAAQRAAEMDKVIAKQEQYQSSTESGAAGTADSGNTMIQDLHSGEMRRRVRFEKSHAPPLQVGQNVVNTMNMATSFVKPYVDMILTPQAADVAPSADQTLPMSADVPLPTAVQS